MSSSPGEHVTSVDEISATLKQTLAQCWTFLQAYGWWLVLAAFVVRIGGGRALAWWTRRQVYAPARVNRLEKGEKAVRARQQRKWLEEAEAATAEAHANGTDINPTKLSKGDRLYGNKGPPKTRKNDDDAFWLDGYQGKGGKAAGNKGGYSSAAFNRGNGGGDAPRKRKGGGGGGGG
jgi:hypothetical protein